MNLRAGVDFHPENGGCPPFDQFQSQEWNDRLVEFLDTSQERLVLADERPGTRLRMNTMQGIVEFTVGAWGEQQQIDRDCSVYAKVHTSKIEAMSEGAEVAILGAAEDGLMRRLGTINKLASLIVQPLFRRALYQEERDLPEAEYRERVADGRIIQTQMGSMAFGFGEPRIVPAVASLVRLPSHKNKTSEIIFDLSS